jgi:hypothetical protein
MSVVGSAWSLRVGTGGNLDRSRLRWLDRSMEAFLSRQLDALPQGVWVVYWSLGHGDIPLCLLQTSPGGQAAVVHPADGSHDRFCS